MSKNKKSERSSFTTNELDIVRNIFQRVGSFPSCPTCRTDKAILVSLSDSDVLVRCSTCGWSKVSCGGSWSLVVRHRSIVPSVEICSKNCLCWDSYQKCPIFLKGRLCLSWRPIDLGDSDEVVEDVPFAPESLGSRDPKMKVKETSEPVDSADEEEEETEEDGGY